MFMTFEQAKTIVSRSNPNAVWEASKHDSIVMLAFDNTYSADVKAVIYEFDGCLGTLWKTEPSAIGGLVEITE